MAVETATYAVTHTPDQDGALQWLRCAMQHLPYAYSHYTIPMDGFSILTLIVLIFLAFALQALDCRVSKKEYWPGIA